MNRRLIGVLLFATLLGNGLLGIQLVRKSAQRDDSHQQIITLETEVEDLKNHNAVILTRSSAEFRQIDIDYETTKSQLRQYEDMVRQTLSDSSEIKAENARLKLRLAESEQQSSLPQ